ncbi:hypothetical protein DFH27DRAFT_522631 [Peziza echinospora]|nr:hypothetical protein DFH27DRAFT_522631 [Peziza echinospora]
MAKPRPSLQAAQHSNRPIAHHLRASLPLPPRPSLHADTTHRRLSVVCPILSFPLTLFFFSFPKQDTYRALRFLEYLKFLDSFSWNYPFFPKFQHIRRPRCLVFSKTSDKNSHVAPNAMDMLKKFGRSLFSGDRKKHQTEEDETTSADEANPTSEAGRAHSRTPSRAGAVGEDEGPPAPYGAPGTQGPPAPYGAPGTQGPPAPYGAPGTHGATAPHGAPAPAHHGVPGAAPVATSAAAALGAAAVPAAPGAAKPTVPAIEKPGAENPAVTERSLEESEAPPVPAPPAAAAHFVPPAPPTPPAAHSVPPPPPPPAAVAHPSAAPAAPAEKVLPIAPAAPHASAAAHSTPHVEAVTKPAAFSIESPAEPAPTPADEGTKPAEPASGSA